MKTGEDCAIFPCPDVSPGGFEPPTFRLGGEPSIQLRYEDILDFPLFSRLCRDGQENHESNDSARRTSRLESSFPVSNAEQKIRNSIWRMITFFLGGEPSIQLRYEDILDFPLFSRLCRDGQENHESNDSARRTSRLESSFPVSNAEQKIRNSIWRMITFF